MPQRTWKDDAEDCRLWAMEFRERPEQALLLRLASEFENLAKVTTATSSIHEDDLPYFASRASQEITAAVRARHPKARLAHLAMAQRYELMSHRN